MTTEKFVHEEGLAPKPLSGLAIATGTSVLPHPEAAAGQFQRFSGFAFDGVLESTFRVLLRKICDTGTFISDQSKPGHREVEAPQKAGRALSLALNRTTLLRWLETVTACGPLREISGRIVRTLPRPGDELQWHDDFHERSRRLAIVINLGTVPFDGGEFELRRKSGEILLQHKHGVSDSMLIFKISPELEHRVLPLDAGGPRLVYTGWALAPES